MKRYQLYLKPGSVAVIDDFEKLSVFSRSRIIREILDRVADVVMQTLVFSLKKIEKSSYSAFDKYIGAIDIKTKKRTHFAEEDDSIY